MTILGSVALVAGCWLLVTAGLSFWDARRLGANQKVALRLAALAWRRPLVYWYVERMPLLPDKERAQRRAREARRLGLKAVENVCCPVCGAEIEGVWGLGRSGWLEVRERPAACPQCDFRVDSCRHCTHFQGRRGLMHQVDLTQGSCAAYRTVMPVEELCQPEVARELEKRGYTHLRGPTPIVDSYVPLPACRAFAMDERLLRANGVRVPNLRQRGLLRRVGDSN